MGISNIIVVLYVNSRIIFTLAASVQITCTRKRDRVDRLERIEYSLLFFHYRFVARRLRDTDE